MPLNELESNSKGIPKAPFIENISQFLQQQESPDSILMKFREMLSKYRFMETHTLQRIQALQAKIPELQKSIEILQYLQHNQDQVDGCELSFELEETLYCRAKIPQHSHQTAYIWLGANVMVEYPVQEALSLLQEKATSCDQLIGSLEDDKLFLREQMTTIEVNIARLYNWTVQNKA